MKCSFNDNSASFNTFNVSFYFVFCLAERFTKTVLQEVAVPIISNFECRQRYQQAGLYQYSDIPDIMLCAGYKKGGKDACQVRFNILHLPV